ncbi:MAG: DUF87 domain-containing protein [Candidatus Paceibacterota bacterium]
MAKEQEIKSIEPLSQTWRITVLAINVLIAWVIYYFATGSFFPTGSGASVWLLAAMAYWLLHLVSAPFFLPPRDSLTTAISLVLLLAPLDFTNVSDFSFGLQTANTITIVIAIFVATCALVSAFQQNTQLGKVTYRLSGVFGKGEILFTPAVLISALGFYQSEPEWMVTILGFWTFMVVARPVEHIIQVILYLNGTKTTKSVLELTGSVLRIDAPNLVRITLEENIDNWTSEYVHIAHLSGGKITYVLPLFSQIQNEQVIGTGLCCEITDGKKYESTKTGEVYSINEEGLAETLGVILSGEERNSKVVGITVEGSSISNIKFQSVSGIKLEEGVVVFACIRGKKVYYQILDASTNEESFHQNPYGVHIVSAAQLGCYDPNRGFEKYSWLPEMNQPLFLTSETEVHTQNLKENEFMIGKVPSTSFGIPVVLDDLIEYHTAVLGVTGTGKTELVLDIIREAVARGRKVFCVDFTGEYKKRLADLDPVSIGLSITQGSDLETHLFAVEIGTYGAPNEKRELKTFIDGIKPQVTNQIEDFLTSKDDLLGIFELAEITNTKATLRTTELYLSAIMNWARNNRKAKQIMIVLEEAHTIIPEVYSSGFDSETQWVVGRIGQIALQGRKYGVGLLIVSQRTALVSKTVLSQCNTYFTHSLVDKTSLEYLGSVYSSEHIKAIPNLKFLEFVAHGKAVKSERPLLAKREFDKTKYDASVALNVKVVPITTAVVEVEKGSSF